MPKNKEPLGGITDITRKVETEEDAEAVNKDLDLSDDRTTRAQSAFALKLSGASYTDIARVLDYSSPTHARQAVERVLASAADSPEDIDKMRVLQTRRYERLLQSVMSKAVDPDEAEHLAYNARALAIIDRISKLHGVDAPTQVQFTPTDEYIQNYTRRMMEIMGVQQDAIEADIDVQDAEIVDE